LAGHLIQYQPEMVITSPEPKARETAEILAHTLQLPIQEIDDLHEHVRSAVPYLSKHEFEEVVREFFEKPGTLVFGNETADQAYERFSRVVNCILYENDTSSIVIVAHGTVISLFVSRLIGQPGYKIWSELGLPCFVVLDMKSKELIALENIS